MSVAYCSGGGSGDTASTWVRPYSIGHSSPFIRPFTHPIITLDSEGETQSSSRRKSPHSSSLRSSPTSSRVRQRTPNSSSAKRANRQLPTVRARAKSQTDISAPLPLDYLFTPSTAPVVVPAAKSSYSPKKSASSPQLVQGFTSTRPNFFEPHTSAKSSQSIQPGAFYNWPTKPMDVSSDDDDQEDEIVFPTKFAAGVRARHSSGKLGEEAKLRGVTTARDKPCAGETETELDGEPGGLPTARHVPEGPPLIPPPTIRKLTPYLFEFSRLLAIVPALFGTVHNIYYTYHAGSNIQHSSTDYMVAALWSILTGYQCLALTTGLFRRWQIYYSPLSTLIRLVALQGICWPATHFTLLLFDYVKRPLACWIIIGSTTCFSRSVQIWVTSNLWPSNRSRRSGKLGERRWNWAVVGLTCLLPAGILYFITAWALIFKVEQWNC